MWQAVCGWIGTPSSMTMKGIPFVLVPRRCGGLSVNVERVHVNLALFKAYRVVLQA